MNVTISWSSDGGKTLILTGITWIFRGDLTLVTPFPLSFHRYWSQSYVLSTAPCCWVVPLLRWREDALPPQTPPGGCEQRAYRLASPRQQRAARTGLRLQLRMRPVLGHGAPQGSLSAVLPVTLQLRLPVHLLRTVWGDGVTDSRAPAPHVQPLRAELRPPTDLVFNCRFRHIQLPNCWKGPRLGTLEESTSDGLWMESC